MIGIMIIACLIAWILAAASLSVFIVRYINSVFLKAIAGGLFFILFLIAPLYDEIIGGFQFRALCKPENLLVYDPEKIRERTVETKDSTVKTLNKIISIHELTRKWFSVETGEVLITQKIYEAKGGWLSRFLGGGTTMFTLNGKCSSKEYYQLFEKYNVTKNEN